jgi:hypothetical protein
MGEILCNKVCCQITWQPPCYPIGSFIAYHCAQTKSINPQVHAVKKEDEILKPPMGPTPEFGARPVQSIKSFGAPHFNQLGIMFSTFPPLHGLGILPPPLWAQLTTSYSTTLSPLGRDPHTPPPLWCTVALGAASGLGTDIFRQHWWSD